MPFKKIFIVSSLISLLIPVIAHGQIKISEIMYDPEGSDTKREWIEVFNGGTSSVDLSTYTLFENNVYHKLVAQGKSIIEAGGYAIIVDSVAEVISEYKDFVGALFDSTFSLNNTGETISLVNSNKEVIDEITYSNEMGGNNTGNSIQINEDSIIEAKPTFGISNRSIAEPIIDGGSEQKTDIPSSGNTPSTHQEQETQTTYTPTTQFKLGIGRKRHVSIYTPIEFIGDISKQEIKPKITWNLGDFNSKKGKKIEHTYIHEGIYEVIATAKKDGYTSVSCTEVIVSIPDLEIIQSTSTISFKNKAKTEVNIGGFILKFFNGEKYRVPDNTIIKSGTTIYKDIKEGDMLEEFVYPNSEIYQRFDTI